MSTTFAEWAARRDTQKVYAADLEVVRISDGATLTVRLSTHGGVWDGSHYYVPALRGLPVVRHRFQKLTSGRSLVSFGNLDVALDPEVEITDGLTMDDLLADYAWAGRPITVRVGGPELDWGDWGVVLAGRLGQPEYTVERARIPVAAASEDLRQREAPPNTYDDTVTASARGRAKPLCWGWCYNVAPVLTGENPWVYQVHDPAFGPIQAVDAVYVDGVQTTSGFTVDLSQGTVTFTADPQGTVTLDVRGRVAAGSFLELPGDIIQDLLTSVAGYSTDDIDAASFSQFNTDAPYPVGLYLDTSRQVLSVVDGVLNGLLGSLGVSRAGKLFLHRFTAPAGPPALELLGELEVLDLRVEPEERLYWRVRVGGERCWSTNTSPAASVTADRRAWLKEAYRWREVQDSAVQGLYPLAGEAKHETLLKELADCATVAGWWLDLFGQRRRLLSCRVKLQPLAVELGDVVQVSLGRFGLGSGWLGRVVEVKEDHLKSEVDLKLWG